MYEVFATASGWAVFQAGRPPVLALFERLSTVKKLVEGMGGSLTVFIDGTVAY